MSAFSSMDRLTRGSRRSGCVPERRLAPDGEARARAGCRTSECGSSRSPKTHAPSPGTPRRRRAAAPWPAAPRRSVHFSTTPLVRVGKSRIERRSRCGRGSRQLKLREPYGQRPCSSGSRCSGASPSSRCRPSRFQVAWVGQTRTQGGLSQWLQSTSTGSRGQGLGDVAAPPGRGRRSVERLLPDPLDLVASGSGSSGTLWARWQAVDARRAAVRLAGTCAGRSPSPSACAARPLRRRSASARRPSARDERRRRPAPSGGRGRRPSGSSLPIAVHHGDSPSGRRGSPSSTARPPA